MNKKSTINRPVRCILVGPVAQPSCVSMQKAEGSVRKSYRLATCRAMPVTKSDTEL